MDSLLKLVLRLQVSLKQGQPKAIKTHEDIRKLSV